MRTTAADAPWFMNVLYNGISCEQDARFYEKHSVFKQLMVAYDFIDKVKVKQTFFSVSNSLCWEIYKCLDF